jgi:GT2 family glycosyltransferase
VLDDGYGCYFEDVDLCWRVWLAGYEVVCNADSIVEHYGGGTSHWSTRSYGLAERNRLLTYYKNLGLASLAVVFPVMLLCRLLIWTVVRRDRAILQGLVEGLRRIPGYRSQRVDVQRLRRMSDRRVFAPNRSHLASRLERLWHEARRGHAEGR